MTKDKYSIRLDEELLAQIRDAATAANTTTSGWIRSALRNALTQDVVGKLSTAAVPHSAMLRWFCERVGKPITIRPRNSNGIDLQLKLVQAHTDFFVAEDWFGDRWCWTYDAVTMFRETGP